MANLDPVKNFAIVTVSTTYDASATSIALTSGHGARLPAPSTDGAFNLVWWNSTDYSNPADDPNVEIVRVTARSTDTLTVTRAQESTSASTKNTASKTYKMALVPTKKLRDDLESLLSFGVGAKPSSYFTYALPLYASADVTTSDDRASGYVTSGINTTSDWNGLYSKIVSNSSNCFSYFDDNSGSGAFPGTGSSVALSFNSSKKVVVSFRFKGDSSNGWFVGLGTNTNANFYTPNTSTGDRAGFSYDGTTFRSITDDGTTKTSKTISGVTVTDWNTLRIEFDPSSECRFYVNGTLVSTHSSGENLPNGGLITFGCGHSATGKTWYMSQPTISIEI